MRVEIHPVAEITPDGKARFIIWKREFQMVTIANRETCPKCYGLGYDEKTDDMCQECAGRGEIFNGTKEVKRAKAKYTLVIDGDDTRWVAIPENCHVPAKAYFSGETVEAVIDWRLMPQMEVSDDRESFSMGRHGGFQPQDGRSAQEDGPDEHTSR